MKRCKATGGRRQPNAAQPVPKELWRLLNHLADANALQEPNLFFVKGDEMQRQAVSVLDSGQEFLEGISFHPLRPCSTSSALLLDPSFPSISPQRRLRLYFHVLPGVSLFQDLPSVHLNVLIYIIAFLKDLLSDENRAHNELQVIPTCELFARVLFRPGQAVVINKTRVSMSQGGGMSEISNWLRDDHRKEVYRVASGEKLVAHLVQHYG